jgi:uncharacterized protein
MRRAWVLVGAAAVVVVAAGTALATHHPPPLHREIVIATGGPGGVYEAYGKGLAAALSAAGLPARVRETGASVENLRLLASGEADVGFALADSAAAALEGRAPFSAPLRVASLARLYDNYTHLVVPAGSPVHTLADLRGKRVSTGSPGSGTEVIAERLLRLAGVDPDRSLRRQRLGVAESARALRERRTDAFFWSGGLPTAAIGDLATGTPIRLVDLGGAVDRLRDAYGDFYAPLSIPASAYGLGRQVATVSVPNYLVVSAAIDEATAYRLTAVLFEAQAHLVSAHPEARRLNRRAAISTWPLPLHPGALRYYRETKT